MRNIRYLYLTVFASAVQGETDRQGRLTVMRMIKHASFWGGAGLGWAGREGGGGMLRSF